MSDMFSVCWLGSWCDLAALRHTCKAQLLSEAFGALHELSALWVGFKNRILQCWWWACTQIIHFGDPQVGLARVGTWLCPLGAGHQFPRAACCQTESLTKHHQHWSLQLHWMFFSVGWSLRVSGGVGVAVRPWSDLDLVNKKFSSTKCTRVGAYAKNRNYAKKCFFLQFASCNCTWPLTRFANQTIFHYIMEQRTTTSRPIDSRNTRNVSVLFGWACKSTPEQQERCYQRWKSRTAQCILHSCWKEFVDLLIRYAKK